MKVAPALAADEDNDERIVLSGPVLVDRDEEVGDVVVVDGDIVIRGGVQGDVVALGGDVTIRGCASPSGRSHPPRGEPAAAPAARARASTARPGVSERRRRPLAMMC